MRKKLIVLGVLFLLIACGGGNAEQAAVAPTETPETATAVEAQQDETEGTDNAGSSDTAGDESEEGANAESESDATAEEETADNGDQPTSGTDPETGLAINPEEFSPGDTFIVRGTIISMNLTPTTSPEFLVESPAGRKYRIATQGLADIYYEDGSQLQSHEYRQGMKAKATVTFPANATLADVLESEDLTLIEEGE